MMKVTGVKSLRVIQQDLWLIFRIYRIASVSPPKGQSKNPFSEYYEDQAEMYVNGIFRKMMMNEKEIKYTSKSLLTFKPLRREWRKTGI